MKCAKNNIKYKLEKLKISYLKVDNKELSVMKCLSGKKGKFMRRFIENYFVIRTYEVSRKRVINK
jgi:hypothetical protein